MGFFFQACPAINADQGKTTGFNRSILATFGNRDCAFRGWHHHNSKDTAMNTTAKQIDQLCNIDRMNLGYPPGKVSTVTISIGLSNEFGLGIPVKEPTRESFMRAALAVAEALPSNDPAAMKDIARELLWFAATAAGQTPEDFAAECVRLSNGGTGELHGVPLEKLETCVREFALAVPSDRAENVAVEFEAPALGGAQ